MHKDEAASRVRGNLLFSAGYIFQYLCILALPQVIVDRFQVTDVFIKRSDVHNSLERQI